MYQMGLDISQSIPVSFISAIKIHLPGQLNVITFFLVVLIFLSIDAFDEM